MLELLIFDFDGTILDTETPEYQAWSVVFKKYDSHLPLSVYLNSVGGGDFFDPIIYLQKQITKELDYESIKKYYKEIFHDLLLKQSLMPGVLNILKEAKKNKLKVAIASSSDKIWVTSHIERLNIAQYFDCIKCSNDVLRIKPYPDLFLSVINELQVCKKRTIAFEDSQNGINSAVAANLFCIAIPNKLTKNSELKGYARKIKSLENIALEDLRQLAKSFWIKSNNRNF